MAAIVLTPELLRQRLEEAKTTAKLNLWYTSLQTLPPDFSKLVLQTTTHLRELELSSNSLTDLPWELGDLHRLRVLRMKYNLLEALPKVLGRMGKLEVLELADNRICNVEDEILVQLHNVKEFDLSGNLIEEVAAGLRKMPSLQILLLDHNRLESLPDSLADCPSLTKLDVSHNKLKELPASLAGMKKISRLNFSSNFLRIVPSSIGRLHIKELDLRSNPLLPEYQARASEGLSRLLAFLREEAQSELLAEMEKLKAIGKREGHFMVFSCKESVLVSQTGQHLTQRMAYTVINTGEVAVLFGGIVSDSKSNEVWQVALDRLDWHLQQTFGDVPTPRSDHCAVYDPANKRSFAVVH